MKFKELTKTILLLITICIGFFIHPIPPISAITSEVVEITQEDYNLTNKSAFTLQFVKEDNNYSETSFQIPDTVSVEISEIDTNYVLYEKDNNLLTIYWTDIGIGTKIQIDLDFKNYEKDQFIIIAETLLMDEQQPSIINEVTITLPKEESVASEAAESSSDINISSAEEVTENESSASSSINSSSNENEESSSSVKDSDIESTEESSESLESSSQMTRSAIAPQTLGPNTVSVSNWNGFVNAMGNANVGTINLTARISNSFTLRNREYRMNGDKVINGSVNTPINFANYKFNIQNNEVTINGLVIEAEQNTTFNDSDSLFFSEVGGTLNIQNSSFNDKQRGQVAKLPLGTVNIYGYNIFTNHDEFEIIEAKNIVFKQSSSFIAGNAEDSYWADDLANVLFLYNNGSITVEKDAKVELFNNNRKTLISIGDNTKATINIKDGGQLHLTISNKNAQRTGEPLLYLPGAGSKINMEVNAIFNIQNHNKNNPGPLINLNGSITLNPNGSKVELWQKDSNLTQTSGQYYAHVPRVLDGQLIFGTNAIVPDIKNATANPQSTLSISDNANFNNKNFANLMSGLNTQNLNRIQFSGAESISPPKVNKITDLDDAVTGITSPGAKVTIKDAQNNAYTTTADANSGQFTVNLGQYAPYDYGDILSITASDAYSTSEPTNISVTGDRFTLRVNDQMIFQQTMISNDSLTIPRIKTDWQVNVLNSRGVQNWKLTARADGPLTSTDGSHNISDALIYKKDNVSQSLNSDVLIHQETSDLPGETNIKWEADEGILLQLNPIEEGVKANTEYTGTLNWTLTDAP